jgi:hypothetical protein
VFGRIYKKGHRDEKETGSPAALAAMLRRLVWLALLAAWAVAPAETEAAVPAGTPCVMDSDCTTVVDGNITSVGFCFGGTCRPADASDCASNWHEPAISPNSSLPKYFMIGDSISIGIWTGIDGSHDPPLEPGGLYQLLKATHEATHSEGNAGNSLRGVACLKTWVAHAVPDPCIFDKVSFNFGIHDTNGGTEHTRVATYEAALDNVTRQLRQCKNTKLLYTTTIALASNITSSSPGASPFINEDIVRYNQVAKQVRKTVLFAPFYVCK